MKISCFFSEAKQWFALALAIGLSVPGAVLLAGAQPVNGSTPLTTSVSKSTAFSERDKIIHVLNRLGYGPRPGDVEAVEKMGIERYISQQLNPKGIAYPRELTDTLNAMPSRKMSNLELFRNYGPPVTNQAKVLKQELKSESSNTSATPPTGEANPKGPALAQGINRNDPSANQALIRQIRQQAHSVLKESIDARLLRALNSPRQLEEVMTDFWFNHFNVSAEKGFDYVWVGSYEEQAIRPYALGNFRQLLGATAKHPAMLFYLDNWLNTAPGSPGAKGRFTGLNENYARELMELHTLGVDGGYSQKDVTELARVLSGWGIITKQAVAGNIRRNNVNPANFLRPQAMVRQMLLQPVRQNIMTLATSGQNGQGFYFDPKRHDFGTKMILSHQITGSGEPEIEQVLDILAYHPATAHHISYQLAQYFVSDNPPRALVDRLTQEYMASHGDIKRVMTLLVHSPEFTDPQYEQAKYKSPYRYLITALRASDVQSIDPMTAEGMLKKSGMPLYACLTPDGYKNTQDAWMSPDSLVNRINFATALSSGNLPFMNMNHQPLTTDLILESITLSPKTVATVKSADARLRPAMILGSPDFMMY